MKRRIVCFAAFTLMLSTLKSQNYCYAENFVATELKVAPTDSLDNELNIEVPLKSYIKVLFKTVNDHYFVSVANKFGYLNGGTLAFIEPDCKNSIQFHPYYPANIAGRNITSEIKDYVESHVIQWQQKGEFEKSADYQKRVNEKTRNAKIKEATQVILSTLKAEELLKITNETFMLSKYDADHESFLIQTEYYGEFALKVPIANAPSFKENWDKISFSNIDFEIKGNRFFISKVDLNLDGKKRETYTFDDKNSVTYENTKINYNFPPIKIENVESGKYKNVKNVEKTIHAGKSDVDSDIPKSALSNDTYFAVIIGNENYSKEIKVHYATDDSKTMKEYFLSTLGIPERNIHYIEDATYGEMLSEIDWLNGITKAYAGKVKLFFYYAGHGIPNPETKSAYLLPVDGYASNTGTAIKTEDIYNKLVQNDPELVTVFLDACFSGAAREGMLADGRGVSIKPKKDALAGKIVVLSAASSDETAYPYDEKNHGLFTYFLLKKIQESKGEVTFGELAQYVQANVNQQSMILRSKNQTPLLNSGLGLGDTWSGLKIK